MDAQPEELGLRNTQSCMLNGLLNGEQLTRTPNPMDLIMQQNVMPLEEENLRGPKDKRSIHMLGTKDTAQQLTLVEDFKPISTYVI